MNVTTSDRKSYYESDEGLGRLSSWYSAEKENSFIDFIFNDLSLPRAGLVVEIGGGAGIHGRILAQRFGERYLFTDLSQSFVYHARDSGLPAAQMDGLALALDTGSAACVFLMATSTIIHDQEMRQHQFRECARVLRPDGVAIFVTARRDRRYHSWNRDDVEFLRNFGFSTIRLSWGIIPGRLWNSTSKSIFSIIEKIAATTSLPGRDILLARRP